MKAFLQSLDVRLRVKKLSKRGQTLVEYAIIIALLSVTAVAMYAIIDSQIASIFVGISNILDTAQSSH
jgi:Flp pilus assembly pilin Flp